MSDSVSIGRTACFAAAVLQGQATLTTLAKWRAVPNGERRRAMIEECQETRLRAQGQPIDGQMVEALTTPAARVAMMLVRGGCCDAKEAAEAFASMNPVLEAQEGFDLVSRAKYLAHRWYRDAELTQKMTRPTKASAFPDAVRREREKCPLRAGEIAADLAMEVAEFLSSTEKARSSSKVS